MYPVNSPSEEGEFLGWRYFFLVEVSNPYYTYIRMVFTTGSMTVRKLYVVHIFPPGHIRKSDMLPGSMIMPREAIYRGQV